MELSESSIDTVICPTAAFCNVQLSSTDGHLDQSVAKKSWQDSPLNPKNRIDSLDIPINAMWKIDGCTAFGSQFYATPLFVENPAPLRIDVFIPEPSNLPADVRKLLQADVLFHTRAKDQVSRLGLTRHVLRMLHYWVLKMDSPSQIYNGLPFGSKIVFKNFPMNISQAIISVVPAHELVRELLSPEALQEFWGPDLTLPPTIDINETVYVKQLHDSVCLIEIDQKLWIFKGLTSYSKYLYHELRQLLALPPHPNVISRPVHLVTKKSGFGSKTSVVGFTVEYHAQGSLRDLIPFLQLHNKISLKDKVKWTVQLSSAVLHLREKAKIFYPDLRLDNIVLSASGDVVMVDFEQRGVWCEFAAPEVNAVEYIRLLAIYGGMPKDMRERYESILTGLLPNWRQLGDGQKYSWPCTGYNVAWSCLTPVEQEACEVYMLGRVLWCIFEAKSAPQRAAVWLSYPWEPVIEFPGYTTTPQPMRDLIDRCTRGRVAGLSKHIVREGNQLVLRELERTGLSTPQQVQDTAKKWWAVEIKACEEWLQERAEGLRQGTWSGNYYNRPTLKEVHSEVLAYLKTLDN